ncbi:MAG: 2-C-methyl-D-erythritol 2,4-cyclodiphosphate synthase [Clostridia bacterium]|nr:2-C-methyl-D-erythritol 2,4-cyclodiphosphate synthase [Clostridia bacterium]
MRVGMGYDIHRLVPGRDLVLGGIKIPYHLGLLGHSDADVLVHAICDALLGAAGEGDIGRHFPPGYARYLNISSMELLKKVREMISPSFSIINVDAVIIAEEPKLAPYIPMMRENLKECLGLKSLRDISIKATTNEGVGEIGRGQAVAAFAVACLEER